MRIVHTSDWHAGRLWRGVNRLPELAAALEDLGEFIVRERIDLVLMSGDVFDSPVPPAEAERVVFEFFKRVGCAGVKTVVIAGNHDSPTRVRAWGTLLELVNVWAVPRPLRAEEGGVVEITTARGEWAVVAAVPFAAPGAFVRALDLGEGDGIVHQKYADALRRIVQQLSQRFRDDAVNLLVAHAFLEGAVLSGSERQVHVGEQWAATPQSLPARAHYVALGHVHRPQRVEGAPSQAHYAGSVLQLDFNEAKEEKSFVVIEAHPAQPVRIHRVPYQGTIPLVDVHFSSLEELERRAPEFEKAGWLRVTVELPRPDPDLSTRVRRLLPRAVVVRAHLPQTPQSGSTTTAGRPESPQELYRLYHRQRYGTDPERALLEAFDRLRERAEEA